jgi:ABC-type amino acid transport system permease subunit
MRRLAFDARRVHVRFLVHKMALGHIYLQVLRNSPVDIVPPMLQIIFIYMLLLPNGQTAEAWEHPERDALSELVSTRYKSTFT